MPNDFGFARPLAAGTLRAEALTKVRIPVPLPTPAPAPVPAVEPSKAPQPALCIVEYYQLTTMPGDIGLTRNIAETINIAGHAKQEWFIRTRRVVKSTSEVTTSALESQDHSVAKGLSKSIRDSSEMAGSRESTGFKFDASFHGEVDIGFSGGSTDADVHAAGSTSAIRDSFKGAVESSVNQQVSSTEQFRTQRATSVASKDEKLEEGESIQTYVLDNSGNPLGVTYILCQLAVERMTALSLVNIKLGFFDANKRCFETTALSGMDALIARVIPNAEHRLEVRKALLEQISLVTDYRDEPRQFIEKRTMPSLEGSKTPGEFYRVIPELSTEVSVKRPDGTRRAFIAPGIAISTEYRVVTVPQLGLARGVAG